MYITFSSVWLMDVSQSLRGKHYYHGFDISSEQFPQYVGEISFSTHDIAEPFPEEHLGCYDIVHVRLLIAALRESKYSSAVANIHALLSTSFLLYGLPN